MIIIIEFICAPSVCVCVGNQNGIKYAKTMQNWLIKVAKQKKKRVLSSVYCCFNLLLLSLLLLSLLCICWPNLNLIKRQMK